MASGEEADENAVDNVLLTDDDLADLAADLIEAAGSELEGSVGRHLYILCGESRRGLNGWMRSSNEALP